MSEEKQVEAVFVKISQDRDQFGYFQRKEVFKLKNGLTPIQNHAMDSIELALKIISGATGYATFDPMRVRGESGRDLNEYELMLKTTYEKWASMMNSLSPVSFSMITRIASGDSFTKVIRQECVVREGKDGPVNLMTEQTARKLIVMGLDNFLDLWASEKKGEIRRIPLTPKQQEVYQFIRDYQNTNGFSPTFEEIAVGCGLAAKSNVARLVDCLIQRGHAMKIAGHARSLTVF